MGHEVSEDAQRHANEEAFLSYVRQMPSSVGQRFVKNLIEHSGHKAFEDFWDKARLAILRDEKDITLNEPEERALAMALFANSRRAFLRTGAGAALCGLAGLLVKSGTRELSDDLNARYGQRKSSAEAAVVVLKLVGGGASGVLGLSQIAKDDVAEHTIATVAHGEKGQENVAKLVASLDTLLRPIEVSLAETGVGRRL